MLTLTQINQNTEEVIARLQLKKFDAKPIISQVLYLDKRRKVVQVELDNTLAEQNRKAKEIGLLMKNKELDRAELIKKDVSNLKLKSEQLEQTLLEIQDQLHSELVQLPNVPHLSVPVGVKPEDNEVVKSSGAVPVLDDQALAHWDLAKKYNLFSLEDGVKLTGAGFPVFKGQGAKLQRGLIAMFLDHNTEAGYLETSPPYMVNEQSAYATGQLPDKEGQMYHCTEDNFYLIPTSEVPLTNLYRDSIFQPSDLPIKITAYSPCFRREAGSYGKDVRGLNRVHQFDKVEIVRIEEPSNSYAALQDMVSHVESLLQKLELPYRILRLCGGDMSFTSALTYDIEVYSAAQKRWLEVSSVSNFESFQANRLKCRCKYEKGTELVHTLNGSSLALPRIYAALIENNQSPQGIKIPKALVPYTIFDMIK